MQTHSQQHPSTTDVTVPVGQPPSPRATQPRSRARLQELCSTPGAGRALLIATAAVPPLQAPHSTSLRIPAAGSSPARSDSGTALQRAAQLRGHFISSPAQC